MATPHTIAFHTLGCKLNFSETSTIRRKFESLGFQTVNWNSPADIYVLNTCSVTEFADRKCRSAVRKALRLCPDAQIIVIGCYAQLKPMDLAQIPGVDLVLGAAEKFNAHNYISTLSQIPDKGMVRSGEIEEIHLFEEAFSFGDRTRTFLKVQDGCDYKCSFCTIPQARGKSRSNTINGVLENVRKIAETGAKEVVLTGVNLGDFGKNLMSSDPLLSRGIKREENFFNLIQALDKVAEIQRFRISSIEPNLCTDEIIEFVANSNKFVPHFHIPLQSGSDEMLRAMKRRYTRDMYRERIEFIKSLMPHCCIGVDVITGFPGETSRIFDESHAFISGLDISYLHVFTYSERENTPAENMNGTVSMDERRRRNEILRGLSDKMKKYFYSQFIGQSRPVLLERSGHPDELTGYTDNYIKVQIPNLSSEDLINTVNTVNLIRLNQNMTVNASLLPCLASQMESI